MVMRYIDIKCDNSAIPGTPIPGFNNTGSYNPTVLGVVFSNLSSRTGPSGIYMEVTSVAQTPGTGSAAWCTVSTAHGYPQKFWQSIWTLSTFGDEGEITHGNFIPGQTGIITLAGHQLQNRTTNFSVNGINVTAYVDTNTSAASPPASVVIPFIADGDGRIRIRAATTSAGSALNGYTIAYDPDSTVSISTLTPLVSGQTFTVTVSDSSYAATQLIINDGVTTKTVPVTGGSGTFTGNAPALTDGVSMLRVGSTSAKLTNGTLETAGVGVDYSVSYFHPDDPTIVPFTAVRLTSVTSPDTLSAAFALNPAWQIGTDVISDTPERGTFAVDGTFTSSYTGVSYVWYQNPDDRIARLLEVTTDNGEVISVTGSFRPITNEKIEMRAIEMRPITMRPL